MFVKSIKSTFMFCIRKIFFIFFLVGVTAVITFGILHVYRFLDEVKLSGIEIKGNLKHQSPEEVYSIAAQYNNKSFYKLSLDEIKDELLRFPWIKQVYLKRKWPSKLHIEVVERMPLAIYSNEAVIDDSGEIFYPNTLPTKIELPIFYGDIKLLGEMIINYNKIVNFMDSINFSVKELQLMPDQGWRILVNHDINLFLGSKEIEDRLQNFVIAYNNKFKNNIKSISYVDLRYTNGVAVKRKF